jgi:ribonucleoside-diphosphate reductase alpha chain
MKSEWDRLIKQVKETGIRNSQLLAIAPNTSSALVQGCSASVLPIFNKFYMDKNAKGAVPICPPFIKEAFWYYKENKTLDQREVVEVISTIQKWIDQGISFEVLYNLNMDIKAKDIYETLFSAWEKKCKTIYYTRTIQKNSNIMADKEECVSCAN